MLENLLAYVATIHATTKPRMQNESDSARSSRERRCKEERICL